MPWDEVNSSDTIRAIGLSEASRGPRLGIQESFQASMEMQQRNNSVWGLASYWARKDDEQYEKAKAAGKEYTPLWKQLIAPTIDEMGMPQTTFPGPDVYKEVARQFMDGKDSPYGSHVAAQDAHIRKLNAETPGLALKSMSEMYTELKQEAQRAEYVGRLPTTWGTGWAAGMVGTAVGALDPRTDPLNVLSAPLAGGATIPGRIALQGSLQAASEATGQITGVQENRRLLGLEAEPLWAAVAGAAIGGAAFQMLGEGIVLGVRRATTGKWWADTPKDPAPPPPPAAGAMPTVTPGTPGAGMAPGIEPALPPRLTTALQGAFPEPALRSPLGRTRVGVPRVEHDLEHVSVALSPWGGPQPWELPVPQATRLPVGTPPDISRFQIDVPRGGPESMDVLARRYDPDLFNIYDRLVKQRNEAQVALSKEEFDATLITSNEIARLNERIRELSNRAPRTQQLVKDIAALEMEKVAKQEAIRTSGAPETAATRSSLSYVNEQMRDMKPSVERAYNHAQGRWEAHVAGHAIEIDHMVANGLPGIEGSPVRSPPPPPEPPPVELPAAMDDFIKKTGSHAVPELQTPGGTPKAGEAYVDAVLRVQKEQAPLTKEAQDAMVGTLIRLATKEPGAPAAPVVPGAVAAEVLPPPDILEVRVHGRDTTIHLDDDKIIVPGEDGTGERVVSVRQLAKEMEDDKNMLQAVTSCQLT